MPPRRSKPASPPASPPGRPPRSRLEVEQRRAQLLALGLEAFGTRAYDEVSIDDVARAAAISKGLLYHYFPNKRYVAVVREAAALLLDQTRADPSLEPLERARAGIDAYLAHVERHAPAYAALMRGGIGTDQEVALVVEQTRAEFARRVLESLSVEHPSPLLRVTLRGWLGFVEAASLEWIDARDLDRPALGALLLEVLLAVLKTAMAAPQPGA
jgi:AcrR family transcriptional regulator